MKEKVKTKRKKSLLKKKLREYENEMLESIIEKEEQQQKVQCVLDKLPIRARSSPPPPQGDHKEVTKYC